MTSSLSQLVSTGSVNLGSAFETAAVAGLTAGLLNGITYTSGSGFGLSAVSSSNSLASLAGVMPSVGSGVAPTASAVVAQLPEQALAIAGEATIQAGVQEAIEGGSFLTALKNDAVSDVAAAGAGDIGVNTDPLSPQNVLAETALGCAAGAASGTGCASGALGGGTSALLAGVLVQQAGGVGNLSADQRAAIVALSTGASGALAGLLGLNAAGAANAAENESLNNATNPLDETEQQKELDAIRQQHAQEEAALGETNTITKANGTTVVSTTALTSALGGATNGTDYSAIGSTGQIGEQYLQSLGGQSQVYFSTDLGGRYVDQLINGVANESKVGYTSLTSGIQTQIAKDVELMNSGAVNSVNWNFFTSPVTGLGGPSGPLLKALQNSGFGVTIH